MPKVLVVDDDENVRALISEALRKNGCVAKCASSGEEAVEIMRDEFFDVVVSDIVMPPRRDVGTITDLKRSLLMPERDGLEAIMTIRDHYPEAKIIAISGSLPDSADEFLAKAKALGASKALKKPFGLKALIKAVFELAAKPKEPKRIALD